MTKTDYLIAGLLAGSRARILIEELTQLKSDKARGLSKRMGLPIELTLQFGEIDPTANGGCMDWLAKVTKANNGQLPAPPETLNQLLTRYEQLKRVPAFQGNKNILAYKTYEELDTAVGAAHGMASRTEQDRQARELFKIVHKKYPVVSKKGDPILIGGYFKWLEKMLRTKAIILPEDQETVLDAIDKFEVAKRDPEFKGSRNIMSYANPGAVLAAVAPKEGDTAASGTYAPIPDGPGVKLITTGTVHNHYFELYAITTPEAAAVQFAKSLFNGKAGWCVKDPQYFTGSYRMGPTNPAYMFRRDGVPYVLTDIRSKSVQDQNDRTVTDIRHIYELLYIPGLPEAVIKNIARLNPWTDKYVDEIIKGGPDAAIAVAFSKAVPRAGMASEALWNEAESAIQYWREFQWAYPPQAVMEYVEQSPVLATVYATQLIKERIPDLEPLILSDPRAMSAYYDMLSRQGKFPDVRWPEFEVKMNEAAEKGNPLPIFVYSLYCDAKLSPKAEAQLKLRPILWDKYQAKIKQLKK